jgi:hypothetical protein
MKKERRHIFENSDRRGVAMKKHDVSEVQLNL